MSAFHPPNPKKLISSLEKVSDRKPTIIRLRFPRYKNIAKDAELTFEFPFTVLVGKNGTNKSSVLHALYGSVRGQTPSKYWFDTAIDPIEMEDSDRTKNSIVTEYRDRHGLVDQSLKYRTYRGGFEAYWEAAKRTATYGFAPGSGRAEPVEMNVEYFDFRGELSAFDKCFYFIDNGRLRQGDKRLKASLERRNQQLKTDKGRGLSKRAMERSYSVQDYIRNRAPQLKGALDDSSTEFSDDELSWLSHVIGREYTSARFLTHNVYGGHKSDTVFLQATNIESGYSSAFAGSGEFAAAVLIHKLVRAPKGSLILLDEPETSLHPTAQSRLRSFLMDCALRRNMQIVAATHSPAFLRHLPSTAIKLFTIGPIGQVHILNECPPEHAFVDIDDEYASNLEIHVEDDAAQVLVDAAIRSLELQKSVRARVSAGGESAMWRDVETYSRNARDSVFVLFDGDQTPEAPIKDPASIPIGASVADLDKLISSYTKNAKLSFAAPGDPGKPRRDFLRFLYDHVQFLPGQYPEELVWNHDIVALLLKKYGGTESIEKIEKLPPKERYQVLSVQIPGHTKDSIFRHLVSEYVLADGADFQKIKRIIKAIVHCKSVASHQEGA